jgi:hypothetical protein
MENGDSRDIDSPLLTDNSDEIKFSEIDYDEVHIDFMLEGYVCKPSPKSKPSAL